MEIEFADWWTVLTWEDALGFKGVVGTNSDFFSTGTGPDL